MVESLIDHSEAPRLSSELSTTIVTRCRLSIKMRGILFLLVLSAIVGLCSSDDSPMKDILHKDSKQSERMTFLIRKECGAPQNGPSIDVGEFQLLGENENGVVGISSPREKPSCSDTIGFLPINDEKVQVFVTVNLDNGKLPAIGVPPTVDINVISIKLSYKSKNGVSPPKIPLMKCAPDSGKVTSEDLTAAPFTISEPIDERLLKQNKLILQCQSFFIQKKEAANFDLKDFNTGTWFLEVELDGSADSRHPAKREYQGDLTNTVSAVVNIFGNKKKRCDPDKLVLSNPSSDNEKEYKNLVKTLGPADTMKIWMKNKDGGEIDDNIHKTEVTGCFTQSEVGGDRYVIYTAKKPNGITRTGKAQSVTCAAPVSPRTDWSYQAAFDLLDGNGPTPTPFDADETITVECVRYNCRKCAYNPDPKDVVCYNDHGGCKKVGQTPGADYNDCHVIKLDSCTSGHVLLNNAIYEKHPQTNIVCDYDGKYMLSGVEIKTITCPAVFSLGQSYTERTKTKNGTALDACTPTPALQCSDATGCICGLTAETKIPKKLAIVNNGTVSDSTTWLRIETLKFANSTGDWTYTRKHKDGKTKTHTLGKDYGFACVDPTPDPRTEEQKAELKRNPSKNIVFILNIVLLAVIAGVTIPAVIFYVNARIKEREAKKAAKKDKKKEEPQSGEKKDGGEPKKDEEKKNEA